MAAQSGAGLSSPENRIVTEGLKMAAVTAAMVKELREMTGAGMMDCKKALAATDGDMDKIKQLSF